jgi:hypothetical protein
MVGNKINENGIPLYHITSLFASTIKLYISRAHINHRKFVRAKMVVELNFFNRHHNKANTN